MGKRFIAVFGYPLLLLASYIGNLFLKLIGRGPKG